MSTYFLIKIPKLSHRPIQSFLFVWWLCGYLCACMAYSNSFSNSLVRNLCYTQYLNVSSFVTLGIIAVTLGIIVVTFSDCTAVHR